MDAKTLNYLEQHPEVDKAVDRLVRLAIDGISRDGRGETGIMLILKGPDSQIRHREQVNLVFQLTD